MDENRAKGESLRNGVKGFHYLSAKRDEMHWPKQPSGAISAMATANVGFQMEWSVEQLEEELSREGKPHVLQLNAFPMPGSDDWKNPVVWHLYADGFEVASGSGDYAKQCFAEGAWAFRDLCREAVESAGLSALSEREYYLLCRARRVAALEPFDRGDNAYGAREGRVR